MKVRRLISDIITTTYVILLLGYILFRNIQITYGLYNVYSLSISLIYFCGAGIVIYVFNKIASQTKFDFYDFLIFLLIIFGIISTVNAVNVYKSIFGFSGRNEGLCQLISYYVLFLNCKNINTKFLKEILVGAIIIICFIQAVYGVFQYFNFESIYNYEIKRWRNYSSGFEINPNFFGSLILIGLCLSLCIYLFKNNIITSCLTLISSLVLFLSFLGSNAMSVAVAFIFISLLIIILFFVLRLNWRNTLIKTIIILLGFGICWTLFSKNDNGHYTYQLKRGFKDIGYSLVGRTRPIFGSGRFHIWTETFRIVPDNIWNGVGIDNFYYAFGESPLRDIKSSLVVDKAHNEYLQKLITEGIFSLLTYLTLLITLFMEAVLKIIKSENNYDYLLVSLFICFVAYSIQAFFNISVISVAPMFYIVMGLLCSLIKGDRNERIDS